MSQSVFPGPVVLIPQRPQNPNVFPEGHRQGRWPAASWDFSADSACMRMLNRIDRLILLLILGTKRVCGAASRARRRGRAVSACSDEAVTMSSSLALLAHFEAHLRPRPPLKWP